MSSLPKKVDFPQIFGRILDASQFSFQNATFKYNAGTPIVKVSDSLPPDHLFISSFNKAEIVFQPQLISKSLHMLYYNLSHIQQLQFFYNQNLSDKSRLYI